MKISSLTTVENSFFMFYQFAIIISDLHSLKKMYLIKTILAIKYGT